MTPMQVKLSGPGTTDIMAGLAKLMSAAADACQAYCVKSMKEMKELDVELNKRKQYLEAEVKQLEARKHRAITQPFKVQQPSKPAQHMRSNTKPLTPEQMALAEVQAEEKARKRKEAEEANAPLTHGIRGLESIVLEVSEPAPDQQEA